MRPQDKARAPCRGPKVHLALRLGSHKSISNNATEIMLVSSIVKIVTVCVRHSWTVVLVALLLAGLSGYYTAKHFAIKTDINKLISPDLDWRQRELVYEKAFPGRYETSLVVVDAPTQEFAAAAAAALTKRLSERPNLFRCATGTAASPFFTHNGLLFLPTPELERTVKGLGQAGPLIRTLAADQSLRGVTRAMSLALSGVRNRIVTLDALTAPLTLAAEAIEHVLAGKPAYFSWHVLMTIGRPSRTSCATSSTCARCSTIRRWSPAGRRRRHPPERDRPQAAVRTTRRACA